MFMRKYRDKYTYLLMRLLCSFLCFITSDKDIKKRIPFNGILSSCGGRTRTCDLWVMSPTSYLCSTPRSFGTAKVVIIFKYTSFCDEKINFLAYIWTLISLIETAGRSPKGQVKLVLLWGFAECGNRKALRLRAQGVYSCKWPSLNVDNNAASAVLCNGFKVLPLRAWKRQKNQAYCTAL